MTVGFIKCSFTDEFISNACLSLDWLVGCFGFNGPLRSSSVYIEPSPKEREKEERKDRGE